MKRWLVAVFAISGVLCLVPSAAASGVAYWEGTGDRSIRLVDSLTAKFDPMLASAVNAWSDSPVIELRPVAGSTAPASRKACAVEINTIRVCDANYGQNGWAGMATSWQDGSGHLSKVKIRLNTYYVRSDHARRVVVCHELGHALGLGHRKQHVKTSCLTPRLSLGERPDATDMLHVLELHTGLRDVTNLATTDEAVSSYRDGSHTVMNFMILPGGLG